MSMKVFIPQDAIDSWLWADRIEIEGETLRVRQNGASAQLSPAYHFAGLQAGGDETYHLLGTVKLKAAVLALGAEAYMNSVILGETAYEVEPGFLAQPPDGSGSAGLLLVALADLSL